MPKDSPAYIDETLIVITIVFLIHDTIVAGMI